MIGAGGHQDGAAQPGTGGIQSWNNYKVIWNTTFVRSIGGGGGSGYDPANGRPGGSSGGGYAATN